MSVGRATKAPGGRARRCRWQAAVLAAFGVLGTALQATGLVVVQRSFPEVVERAEQIIVGTVSDIRETVATNGAPMTAVTFSEVTTLKGEARTSMTVTFYGGTVGDVVTGIADLPAFTVGDRDVLFIAGNGRDVCPLVGVGQGRFRVRYDAERGRQVVVDNDGRAVIGWSGSDLRRRPARASGPPALGLDEFIDLIDDVLQELRHRPPSP